MLLALYQGQVLLQRRPPSGIWGGLLSLPEFDSTLAVDDWLAANADGELLPAWPEMVHVFTHFRLTITPQPVQLQSLAGSACHDDGWQWLPLAEAVGAFEKDLIQDALKTTRGNRAKAAQLLQSTERIIRYKVKLYDIDVDRFKG